MILTKRLIDDRFGLGGKPLFSRVAHQSDHRVPGFGAIGASVLESSAYRILSWPGPFSKGPVDDDNGRRIAVAGEA